jgi:pyruvate kinase
MIKRPKTKIIATIGPACDSPAILKEMMIAGMNVARLNLSHGNISEHTQRINLIRKAAADIGSNIAIMVDTKGIEIRTGSLQDGSVVLEPESAFILYADDRIGDQHGVAISYKQLCNQVSAGVPILLDDGVIELAVQSVNGSAIVCEIIRGGTLYNSKGVNLPQTQLPIEVINESTRQELSFAAENDVEYVAASFVRNANDVNEIRAVLAELGVDIPIIAKIENREGVDNLDEIIAASNGTMVARGDLGVELPAESVPMVQKKIIRSTVTNGMPVITATQMLDSMERNLQPTRAETSDVANAILDGTSAVMLSGETAVGKYPVQAVKTMASLALHTEASLLEYGYLQKIIPHASNVVTEAVSQAVNTMALHLNAPVIVTLTETGFTSRMISRYRPECPIIAITSSLKVVRMLAMNWGVVPLLYDGEPSDEAKIDFSIIMVKELGLAVDGDNIIVAHGYSSRAGGTNLIRVVTI